MGSDAEAQFNEQITQAKDDPRRSRVRRSFDEITPERVLNVPYADKEAAKLAGTKV